MAEKIVSIEINYILSANVTWNQNFVLDPYYNTSKWLFSAKQSIIIRKILFNFTNPVLVPLFYPVSGFTKRRHKYIFYVEK